jgi:predicted GNAT superfamily acetyltransferase
MTTDPWTLAPLAESDLDDVLALNQRWVPHVGAATRESLSAIVDLSSLALVARAAPRALVGFVLVLPPGVDYASPNYRFFSERSHDFRYVDRIAVDPSAQGTGLGRRLYEAVVAHAEAVGVSRVNAEVNLDPPNPGSQAFHAALGFVEVGRQWTYDDTVQVQLLERRLRA